MSVPSEYIQQLVAHYLKEHGLNTTLASFEAELNKKFSNISIDESIETIVKDRVNFQKLSLADDASNVNTTDSIIQSEYVKGKCIDIQKWNVQYPQSSELLDLDIENPLIIYSTFWSAVFKDKCYNLGLFVTNSKYVILFDFDVNKILAKIFDPLNGQPIKIVSGINGTNNVFICDMNGNLLSFKLSLVDGVFTLNRNCKEGLKLHRRLITDFKFILDKKDKRLGYFASIGWDGRVLIGSVFNSDELLDFKIINDYKLMTNPTVIHLTLDKATQTPILIVGRLNSTLLSVFVLNGNIKDCKMVELCRVSLNDSEFSNHSFQPMSILELNSKTSNTILTIATDHVPYMRLITIMIPPIEEILNDNSNFPNVENNAPSTVLQKLSHIAQTQNSEQSFHSNVPVLRQLIISNFNSISPQDKYSSAILLARPNSSGLWIPGDDGKIRGFDLHTGALMETLDSNDGRAKTAFSACSVNGEIMVICGALDRKIVVWKIK
ncbi:hypothetical protein DAMA08_034110 [Martiniozyma asiatica (nom. inval.)]|nr:hypothetical protein DAMA08_034110 [Martiniozyma asiatica]